MNTKPLLLSAAIMMLVAACGGSGGDNNVPTDQPPPGGGSGGGGSGGGNTGGGGSGGGGSGGGGSGGGGSGGGGSGGGGSGGGGSGGGGSGSGDSGGGNTGVDPALVTKSKIVHIRNMLLDPYYYSDHEFEGARWTIGGLNETHNYDTDRFPQYQDDHAEGLPRSYEKFGNGMHEFTDIAEVDAFGDRPHDSSKIKVRLYNRPYSIAYTAGWDGGNSWSDKAKQEFTRKHTSAAGFPTRGDDLPKTGEFTYKGKAFSLYGDADVSYTHSFAVEKGQGAIKNAPLGASKRADLYFFGDEYFNAYLLDGNPVHGVQIIASTHTSELQLDTNKVGETRLYFYGPTGEELAGNSKGEYDGTNFDLAISMGRQ